MTYILLYDHTQPLPGYLDIVPDNVSLEVPSGASVIGKFDTQEEANYAAGKLVGANLAKGYNTLPERLQYYMFSNIKIPRTWQ